MSKNTKLRAAQRYAKAAEKSAFGAVGGVVRRGQAQSRLDQSVASGGSASGNHRPDRVKGK